jgi:phosphate transport system permease protein
MSDQNPRGHTLDIVMAGLSKRRNAEKRFRFFGLASIVVGLVFLLVLFISIIGNGYSAFTYSNVALDITFDPAVIDPEGQRNPAALAAADYDTLWKASLLKLFPEVTERQEKRALNAFMGFSADKRLKDMVTEDPTLIGTTKTVWLPVDDTVDLLFKGKLGNEEELNERNQHYQSWIKTLKDQDRIHTSFNREFFTNGDSREPEAAGIWGAVVGSAFTLLITIGLSLPIGIAAAIYLEEFAPRNRWTDLIEVNINNLAAVPSIVFGLLGLAVFINFFGLPRSSPLVGGLVLTQMTLPVIIIAGRSALK